MRPEAPNSAWRPGSPRLGLASAVARDDPDRNRVALGVVHLRSDRALPDQLVQTLRLVAVERTSLGVRNFSPAGRIASWASWAFFDSGRCRRAARRAGTRRRRARAPGRARRAAPSRRACRVGAHVSDVSTLVQALRDLHRALGDESELARRLVLQGGGAKRRVGLARVRLRLDRLDFERPGRSALRRACAGTGLVEVCDAVGRQLTGVVEVRSGGDALAVETEQAWPGSCADRDPRRRRR